MNVNSSKDMLKLIWKFSKAGAALGDTGYRNIRTQYIVEVMKYSRGFVLLCYVL